MRKNIFAITVLCLILISFSSAYAEPFERTVVIHAPAVSTIDGDYVGVIGEMNVGISLGNGSIFVETWPLSELDTQASARIAASVASDLTGINFNEYNFYYSIKSDSSVIGGPSAGATLTVATVSAIDGWVLDPEVMMTGMINTDGTVGPVGGIYEKAEAAYNYGIKTFLVPEGQAIVSVGEATIDLREYGPEEWGMDVVEVFDIQEAIYYFSGVEYGDETISGTVPDTSFFADDVAIELDTTSLFAKELATQLYDSGIESSTRNDLNSYLVLAQERIEDANNAVSELKYYTAMSYVFQARISLSYVDNAMMYLSSGEDADIMSSILNDIESYITQVNGDVKEFSTSIKGFSSLEAFSAAQERIYEAAIVLEEAKEYSITSTPANALYSAALAKERTRTSEFWLSVAKSTASGEVISLSQLKTDAEVVINDANLTLVYVSELITTQNSLLSEAQSLLLSAQQEFNDQNYAAALFDATESKAMAATAIELYACEDSCIGLQIERVKENAGQAILNQVSNGITPILSISYYEFASEYEEEGNFIQSKIYYKYSIGIATAFKYLQGGEGESIDFTDSLEESESNETGNDAIFYGGLLLLGILVGFIVSFIYLGRRYNKKLDGLLDE